jgi:PAS domain S-box-containing protein
MQDHNFLLERAVMGEARCLDVTRTEHEAENYSAFLSSAAASRSAKRLALAVVVASAMGFAIALPFVRIQLPQVSAFIPSYESALVISDLVTAILLFGQFSQMRSWALLSLASGYLFDALIIIPHALTFPGVFSATGLLGAGNQSTAWLYIFWHGGFPLFVLAYALLQGRGENGRVPARIASMIILSAVISVAAIVCVCTLLATWGMSYLPVIIQGAGDYSRLVTTGTSPTILTLCLLALIALARQRKASVLDLWLMVVMCVWLFDVGLSAVLGSSRYDLGWYAGRSYGLLAANFVLAVLLLETNRLHEGLAITKTQLADALKKNRARFKQIFDNAPMVIVVKDLDGRYSFVNRGMEQWTDQNDEKILGKTIRDLFGDTEYAAEHEAVDREVLAARKPIQREFTTPHPSGPQTSLFVKFPLFDTMGEVEAIGSIALDVTKQKKADAALERFFQTSVDLILVVDRIGTLLRVSPSSMTILGYQPEEVVGNSATDFIYPEDLEKTRNEMRMARRGRHTRNFETRYIHKDGHIVTLSWTGVWSEQAQQHFFIGRDMAERMKLEQDLRQSQKMEAIGQLTGGIAHDYNNLLTVILGNAELLAEALDKQPELHSLAQLTLDAAERSATLTQRLLAFGRRQALESRATDVNELLVGMTDLMQATLGEQINISLRPGTDLWTPKFDRSQFETAVLNLGINARDAMPDGGTITIETANVALDEDYVALNPSASIGEYVAIIVSDTGTGMTPEVLSKVFEPFFTTKDIGKGTGLGLSMIYGFVKQSGGHITIYSEVGMGTVVRLYFPRVNAPSIVPAQQEPQEMVLSAGNEMILLVEDDPLVRAHTEKQLIALGYRVLTAEKPANALELIGNGLEPDLLFTDVVMPGGMNGCDLADAARRWIPGLKVLFTSGYTHGAILQGDVHEAGTNFLGKPFRRAELAAKIRELLDKRLFADA